MTCADCLKRCLSDDVSDETRELRAKIKDEVFKTMPLGGLDEYKAAFSEYGFTKRRVLKMIQKILGTILNVAFISYSWLYMPERDEDQEYNLSTIVVRWIEFGMICWLMIQWLGAVFLSCVMDNGTYGKLNFKVGILITFDELSWSLFDMITLYDARVVKNFLKRWWRFARGCFSNLVKEDQSWAVRFALTIITLLIVVPFVAFSILLFSIVPVGLLLKLQTLSFVSEKYFIYWEMEYFFFFGFLNQIVGVIARTRRLEYHDYLRSFVVGHSNSANVMMHWLNETCIDEVGMLRALQFVTNIRSRGAFQHFEWTALAKNAPETLSVSGFEHVDGVYKKQQHLRKGCAWYVRETPGSATQYALAFVKYSGKESGNAPLNSWVFVPEDEISESGEHAEYRAKATAPSPLLLNSYVWYHHRQEIRVENPIIKNYDPSHYRISLSSGNSE